MGLGLGFLRWTGGLGSGGPASGCWARFRTSNSKADWGTPSIAPASKSVSLGQEILALFTLALAVASVAWTITHEAIFREMQEYCKVQSRKAPTLLQRKFFYLFTCEYCFSHYVSAIFLAMTRFKLLLLDWRGYVISLFALVWVCNFYISVYNRLRLNIKHEHISIKNKHREMETTKPGGRAA